MLKQKQWRYIKTERKMGSVTVGGTMDRKSGFREYGVKTFHFEYLETN